ncbi:MAG: hypothetical protein IPK11_01370 [Ignavibacteria bacterium]|nr:hypothetical protein [Ignavibacteria bacterium]
MKRSFAPACVNGMTNLIDKVINRCGGHRRNDDIDACVRMSDNTYNVSA